MGLDLRLQQKMTQQLVMTPQLQQAIKLLQLNHLEMAEVLRKEMEENPVLEEGAQEGEQQGEGERAEAQVEAESEGGETDGTEAVHAPDMGLSAPAPEAEGPPSNDGGDEAVMSSDMNAASQDSPADSTPEPAQKELDREIDWENYLETYSYSLPATAGSGGGEELPPFEATLTRPQSLHDHMRWQVQMGDFSEREAAIAAMLIEEINDDGYLSAEAQGVVAEEMGISADEVASVVKLLQEFDPRGVASRDLRECLLLQAAELCEDTPLLVPIIDKHLKNVERRNYSAIAKDLKVSMQEVGDAVKVISTLEPRPGRLYSDKEPQYITPDIYVYKVGDDYQIVLNEDGLPKLKISNYYREALSSSGGQTKTFIQEKLRSAVWLIRSIHMRQRTIYRVVESILKFQRDFFDKGVQHLKPLILKDVAEDVGMHESTISRVTSNKYVHTPQGIYELKYFFNSSINRVGGDSIASESVRDFIKQLIESEDPKTPVSDQQIVELLKKRDIDIARRTVAKYREMLKIPSSSKRKQVF